MLIHYSTLPERGVVGARRPPSRPAHAAPKAAKGLPSVDGVYGGERVSSAGQLRPTSAASIMAPRQLRSAAQVEVFEVRQALYKSEVERLGAHKAMSEELLKERESHRKSLALLNEAKAAMAASTEDFRKENMALRTKLEASEARVQSMLKQQEQMLHQAREEIHAAAARERERLVPREMVEEREARLAQLGEAMAAAQAAAKESTARADALEGQLQTFKSASADAERRQREAEAEIGTLRLAAAGVAEGTEEARAASEAREEALRKQLDDAQEATRSAMQERDAAITRAEAAESPTTADEADATDPEASSLASQLADAKSQAAAAAAEAAASEAAKVTAEGAAEAAGRALAVARSELEDARKAAAQAHEQAEGAMRQLEAVQQAQHEQQEEPVTDMGEPLSLEEDSALAQLRTERAAWAREKRRYQARLSAARTTSGRSLAAGPTEWHYVDRKGTEQGPFSDEQMAAWWMGGHLPPELQVRSSADAAGSGYTTLSELTAAGDGEPPFVRAHRKRAAASSDDEAMEQAATDIQRLWRGHSSRESLEFDNFYEDGGFDALPATAAEVATAPSQQQQQLQQQQQQQQEEETSWQPPKARDGAQVQLEATLATLEETRNDLASTTARLLSAQRESRELRERLDTFGAGVVVGGGAGEAGGADQSTEERIHAAVSQMESDFEEERLQMQSRAQSQAEEREEYFEREKMEMEEGFQRAMLEMEASLEASEKTHDEFVAGMRVAAAEELQALERRLAEDKDKAVATVKMDLVEAEEAVKALRAQVATLEDALASTPR